MSNRIALFFLLTLIFGRCGTKEFDCEDLPIQPAFIGFDPTEIDTLILRKYKPNDNFEQLIDSTIIIHSDLYRTSNDTTKIIHYRQEDGIRPGFDWQLSVPALQKTIVVSGINSNKKEGSCGFMAVGSACTCLNDLFSANQDGQLVAFSDVYRDPPFIYIRR